MRTIAIVGRPNVGKSALFNRLAKRRLAIVDEEEGVTRDRLYAVIEGFGEKARIIDTGGLDFQLQDTLYQGVKAQSLKAVAEANLILFVVDGQVGPTHLDREVAKFLLKTGKPLLLTVNKIDGEAQEHLLHAFHCLGISEMVPVSALHGYKAAELAMRLTCGGGEEGAEEESAISIALIGRTNVGKSTLLNCLSGTERSLVSDEPATTRDAIDAVVEHEEVRFRFVDTAGIRRKQKEKSALEKFARVRTDEAIERSDVCLLLIDAQEGMTVQEKKIAKLIEEKGRGLILLINKWDAVKGFGMGSVEKAIRLENPFLADCPILFISAKTGRNTAQIFPLVQTVYAGLTKETTTGELNRLLNRALEKVHPPMIKGKRLRIYYMTQTGYRPPAFVLFINHKPLITETYQRYLMHELRGGLGLIGCPLKFELRAKERVS